jgi:AcrR family transcriptional regulator
VPKSTFLNLPVEKRQHIFNCALQEFARHPYEQASLTEIVNIADIAKGSMYQYFEDKKDLYKYVVQTVYQHKRSFLQSVWDMTDRVEFFSLVSLYYRQSWRYAKQFPEYHKVTANFWDSRDEALRAEILREKQIRSMEFVDLLQHGSRIGVIDTDVDQAAAWFVYHAVGKALIDNFLEQDVNAGAHEAFIDSVLSILEQGLRSRKGY